MKLILATSIFAILTMPALAAELATGAEIRVAISGNTVAGGMSDGAAYNEFYQADGAIKAEGYAGIWSVEGNEMCFDYGEGASCWGVALDGDKVTWILDGAEAGTGTISAGNPNGF